MKPENALQTLTLFFNDIIGAVIPGAVLLVGILVIHVGPVSKEQVDVSYAIWLVVLLLAFATGHLLLSFHAKCLDGHLARLAGVRLIKLLSIKSTKGIQLEVEQSKVYLAFRAAADARVLEQGVSPTASLQNWGFNDVRSLAMSISTEASSVARRFMFIALLCFGVGAALVILALDFLAASTFFPKTVAHYEGVPGIVVQILLLLVSAWFCCARGSEFFRRALSAPFSIAYAALYFAEKKEKNDGKG